MSSKYNKLVLISGGLGFIGSHVTILLPYKVLILDNLSNSSISRLTEIRKIKPDVEFYQGDYTNIKTLDYIFSKYNISAIIHLAALKSVPQSVADPQKYYIHNTLGTMSLITSMKSFKVENIIFSSSACVYKSKPTLLSETDELDPPNPYGKSKYDIEKYLEHIDIDSISLRYFNPIGGIFKEDNPNNVLPIIARCIKTQTVFNIFGTDYPTEDGTAVRDYISVMDVAEAHRDCLEILLNKNKYIRDMSRIQKIYNLGTGSGVSVQQLVQTINNLTNDKLKYKYTARRQGDVSHLIADPSLIREELNWKARYTLEDCLQDVIKLYGL